ncbi:MAG: hypothetical protein ACE5GO_01740, partial [Anaerolineales bacterium]
NVSDVTPVSTALENTDQVACVVAAANLTEGYYYTVGPPNAAISPTVITLENLTARSTSPLGLPGAAIVGLAGIAAVALRRRSG